jgi:phosphate transport system ATP-binding protein
MVQNIKIEDNSETAELLILRTSNDLPNGNFKPDNHTIRNTMTNSQQLSADADDQTDGSASSNLSAPNQKSESQASSKTVLQTKDLCVGFAKKEILNKIDLSFKSNTITALVGPSGSGKSTFLRTLNRMNDDVKDYWHTGDVLLDNEEIFDDKIDLIALRQKVGMVFQRPNPFPMSIANNVAIGPKIHKMAKKKELNRLVIKYLEQVGLYKAVADRLHDSPFKLSGGQQQLLCLARALAIGPELLLLDEPTSSLDPQTTQAVENLIVDLSSQVTIVIVTHNLAQARRIADFAAFFWDGKLMEYGIAAQVLEDPKNEITAKFVTGKLG